MTNNFAISAGVIKTQNDGYFKISDSQIIDNYAYFAPVTEVYSTSLT